MRAFIVKIVRNGCVGHQSIFLKANFKALDYRQTFCIVNVFRFWLHGNKISELDFKSYQEEGLTL